MFQGSLGGFEFPNADFIASSGGELVSGGISAFDVFDVASPPGAVDYVGDHESAGDDVARNEKKVGMSYPLLVSQMNIFLSWALPHEKRSFPSWENSTQAT